MNFTIKLPKAPVRNALIAATVKGDGLRGGAHKDRRTPRGGNRNEQMDLIQEYENELLEDTPEPE